MRSRQRGFRVPTTYERFVSLLEHLDSDQRGLVISPALMEAVGNNLGISVDEAFQHLRQLTFGAVNAPAGKAALTDGRYVWIDRQSTEPTH